MSVITQLYFAQHGLAVDKAINPDRPLSDAGKKQTRHIARLLHRNAVDIHQIFHSGKLRASQTADIFAEVLQTDSISAVDHFAPNDDVTKSATTLTHDKALYVGHLPHLEKLVTYLLTGDENQSVINFRNSAVACLIKPDQGYQLSWHLLPDMIDHQPG